MVVAKKPTGCITGCQYLPYTLLPAMACMSAGDDIIACQA